MSDRAGSQGAGVWRLGGQALASGRPAWLRLLAPLLLAWACPAQGADTQPAPPPGAAQTGGACIDSVKQAWPVGQMGRRARIAEMQRIRSFCLDDAAFLATLGALLLEDGDATQALVWLERAVMLDPDSLGARVDLAFALAELGQPGALQEISDQLRNRADMPAALRARLYPAERQSAFALPFVRLGHALRKEWSAQAEISVLTGHEGNLDRSPSLSELTLTLPDGPLTLPVESQPRSGAASTAAAALEVAYSPRPSTFLRSGVVVGARSASSRHASDWHQWQWATSVAYASNGWRSHLDFSIAGVGGPLGEPYMLRRLSAGFESRLGDCRARVSAEVEHRAQARTASLNSTTEAWQGLVQCPSELLKEWSWLIDIRQGRDRPESDQRPGGLQRTHSAGVRLMGPVARLMNVDLTWRSHWARDALGYNPLLENNAARHVRLNQLTLELSSPVLQTLDHRVEAVLRWQGAWQSSNLPLFRYQAQSTYGGLRWLW